MNSNKIVVLGVLLCSGFGAAAFGQDSSSQDNQPVPSPSQESTTPGWHRFGERAPAPDQGSPTPQSQTSVDGQPNGQPSYSQPPNGQRPYAPQSYTPPSSLVVPAGTWITVRMNQGLSTDRNQAGDAFTASLAEPVVVQGLVLAHRGQTIGGRVSVSEKSGRVKGTANLGVELTELSLADGQQIPVKTQLIARRGDTSVGRDVGAVGVTSGLGAAIGAAAGGGLGAGIGALAGAGAGTIGVLSTRGRPSIIYPETVLTFRLEQPVTVTSQSMQAFQPSREEDYRQMRNAPAPGYRSAAPYPAPAYPAYPYYPAPAYGFAYGPGYTYGYGPSFSFYGGPGFFIGRGYGRRW